MKIRKTFKSIEDLHEARNAVETLLDYYKDSNTLSDILRNVEENDSKWEECEECHGTGVRKDTNPDTWFRFVQCKKCKGTGWHRVKKGEA